MNWDRVNSENHRARHMDYSARMDESEWWGKVNAIEDAADYQERFGHRSMGLVRVIRPVSSKPVPPLPVPGTAARQQLDLEAARMRSAAAELHRRKATGGLAGAKPTKRQRAQAEAKQLGLTLDELRIQRRERAAKDLELHNRAVELGITVKDLRRGTTGDIAMPRKASNPLPLRDDRPTPMKGHSMQTFRIRRNGDVDVVFDGECLVDASSREGNQTFWTELRIYRTATGRYVAEMVGRSANPADGERRNVSVVDNPADLRQAVMRRKRKPGEATATPAYLTDFAFNALRAAAKVERAVGAALEEHL